MSHLKRDMGLGGVPMSCQESRRNKHKQTETTAPVTPEESQKHLLDATPEASPEQDAVKKSSDAKNAMLAESGERLEKRQKPKNAKDSRTGLIYAVANGPRTPKTLQGPSRRGGASADLLTCANT